VKAIALSILSVGIYAVVLYAKSLGSTSNYIIEMVISAVSALMVLFYKEK
jgi:hypothetical protein